MNPLLLVSGYVRLSQSPGWNAEWDRVYFEKKRIALL